MGAICGLFGVFVALTPWGDGLEETLGLNWLFQLRGPRAAPPEAVVVGIDKASSRQLGVPFDTTRWPRDLHAELIDRLASELLMWFPVVIPLFIQIPLLSATAMHYVEANRDRVRFREVFRYYLPEGVADRLVKEGGKPNADRDKVFGVCLHADAEGYTTLFEGMPPDDLATFMNRYHEAIFAPVRAEGGHISDVVGDAMLAIWAGRQDSKEIRAAAIRAAFGMLEAMDAFAKDESHLPLRSRIGIYCGEMVLTHVGGQDHFEYRAVGDTVNTAQRIQELNKKLGTRFLVSNDLIKGLTKDITTIPLGPIILRVKMLTIDIAEVRVGGKIDSHRVTH